VIGGGVAGLLVAGPAGAVIGGLAVDYAQSKIDANNNEKSEDKENGMLE
jgi:hypothetical protein